jgi:citrate lyase subunit beta / citryl-CoA lyase
MRTEFEVNAGLTPGATRLMPLLETPRGILSAADYLQAGLRRLAGITWGAEDLSAAPPGYRLAPRRWMAP